MHAMACSVYYFLFGEKSFLCVTISYCSVCVCRHSFRLQAWHTVMIGTPIYLIFHACFPQKIKDFRNSHMSNQLTGVRRSPMYLYECKVNLNMNIIYDGFWPVRQSNINDYFFRLESWSFRRTITRYEWLNQSSSAHVVPMHETKEVLHSIHKNWRTSECNEYPLRVMKTEKTQNIGYNGSVSRYIGPILNIHAHITNFFITFWIHN